MLSIAQTLMYIDLCAEAGIDPIPRTEAEVKKVFGSIAHSDGLQDRVNSLIDDPHTAIGYVENIRSLVCLRALGVVPIDHPVTRINISHLEKWVMNMSSADTVHTSIAPYNIGDISKYGAMLEIGGKLHAELSDMGILDKVYKSSNLGRLLSLWEYHIHNRPPSLISEVITPINLSYTRAT